jgi:hypothetical protein
VSSWIPELFTAWRIMRLSVTYVMKECEELAYAAELEVTQPERPAGLRALGAYNRNPAADSPALSALQREIDSYVAYMVSIGQEECMKMNCLAFWAANMNRWPILARMAARVLSGQPTSAETERIFSISKRIHQ